MSAENTPNVADVADSHRRRLMLAVLLMAVISATRAASEVLEAGAMIYLRGIMAVSAIGIVAALGTLVYWKLFKLPAGQRELYFSPDGFVTDALERAKNASWLVTFLVVSVAAGLDRTLSHSPWIELPSVFYFNVLSALMLGTLGSVFFFLDRDAGEAEPEWDASA